MSIHSGQPSLLVLNVDDDPAKLYVRTRLLERAGYSVIEASTGAQALALARHRQPALLLLDIRLPDMNGFAVASQIKSDPLTRAIPVLAVSSHFEEPEFAGGPESGCDAYLPVPAPAPVLLASVRSLVSLRASAAELESEIARRSRVERALQEANARLELALDVAGLGIWEYDIAADRVTASPRTAAAFGFRQPPARLADWLARIHPEDIERVRQGRTRAIAEGVIHEAEYRVLNPDGIRWLQTRSRALSTPEGRPERLVGVSQDITARKQAERALHESEMRYRTLFASIDEGFCIIQMLFDEDGKAIDYRFLDTNAAFAKQTGFVNAQGRRMREVAEIEEHWFQIYGEVALTGRPVRFQSRSDKLLRCFDLFAFQVGAPEDRQVGVLFRDITDRKRAEAERENLLERFRSQTEFLEKLVANLPSGVAVIDPASGRHTLANPAYDRLVGTTCAGKTLADILPLGPLALVDRDIRTVLETRCSLTRREREIEYPPAREGSRWNVDFIPLAGREGQVESILVILQDVTESVLARNRIAQLAAEAEARAREAERGHQTLLALMEHIPEGITIAESPDALIRMVSRHGAHVSGIPAEAVEGCPVDGEAPPWELLHTDGLTPIRPPDTPLARAIRNGEIVSDEELLLRRPDGSTIPILCNAGPIRDRRGDITGGVVAWRDISARKDWEQRLHEVQKRESIGVLAAGIAHDFNNLLTGVLGNASILADSIPPGHPDRVPVDAIILSAERAAALTSQMLAYSGKGRFQIRPVNLSNAVRRLMPLLRPSVSASIRIDLDLAADLPPVHADPAQIDQIIFNLVTNAAEALSNQDQPDAAISISTGATDASGVSCAFLDVRDNGPGIPPDVLPRMFEPFFTTKFTGRGLGLAAVDGIVRCHGGSIAVDTAPQRGAAFRILLPAAASPGRSVTVLVADDDEVICDTVRTTLERHGYSVLTARDGAEAIDLARTHPGGISAVLLDMVMPGISGEDTLRELKLIDPGLPVIVSTGYSQTEARSRFLEAPIAGFLPKPYLPAALIEQVKAVCADTRGPISGSLGA